MKKLPAEKKYEDYAGMEVRYLVDQRTIMRRVKQGILPKPKYFGTRFPRWSIEELDENDQRLAAVRVANHGALAAAEAKAAKKAERKAVKPKIIPAAEKPARQRGRKHAAASVEQQNT
jgi:hypothetical protein